MLPTDFSTMRHIRVCKRLASGPAPRQWAPKVGFSGLIPDAALPAAFDLWSRLALRLSGLRPSALLLCGAVLLPASVLPFGQFLPDAGRDGEALHAAAAEAAGRIGAALAAEEARALPAGQNPAVLAAA